MSLDTKVRPTTLAQVAGNETTIRSIENLLKKREAFPHAVLICGPTGCGKTTIGRILANELGCFNDDYREVDSAQFNGIDTVRDIAQQMRFKPRHPDSKCCIWLIDECHMLGTGGASEKNKAQNGILKMLEDAPSHVYFILCTTDPQRLLPTVRGRCQQFEVSQLDSSTMEKLLVRTARREKEKVTPKVIDWIIEKAAGHPRNAMKLLEKVIGLDEADAEKLLEEHEEKEKEAIALCRALINDKTKWAAVAKILSGLQKQDEEGIRRLVLSYCNSILLKGQNSRAFIIMDEFSEPFYNTGKAGLTLACYKSLFADGE